MADVRLTATNPEDSSVVPVACNAKGELKLEEPILVEGPQGEKGDKGDPGDPGTDGDPFTGNFEGDVSFTGTATVSGDAVIHGVTVGCGNGGVTTNTALGNAALQFNSSGINNTAGGWAALQVNVDGGNNTAFGYSALRGNTAGDSNTALGNAALRSNTEGDSNTAVGREALRENTAGNNNTAFGINAGRLITGSSNTFIGCYQGAAGLSNTLSLSTGPTERMRIASDGAVDFNQKCGFTPDGGLWITDTRGNKYRTTFAANDFMQWEPYEVAVRNEPQLSDEEIELMRTRNEYEY